VEKSILNPQAEPFLTGEELQESYDDSTTTGDDDNDSNATYDPKIFISTYRADGSSYYVNAGINIATWPNYKLKRNFRMLYDTGACGTLLSKLAYDSLPEECRPEIHPVQVEVVGANNGVVNCYGYCSITLELQGKEFVAKALVCDITDDGIIGTDFMFQRHDCRMELEKPRHSRRTRAVWFIDGHPVPLHPYRPRDTTFNCSEVPSCGAVQPS